MGWGGSIKIIQRFLSGYKPWLVSPDSFGYAMYDCVLSMATNEI